MRWAGWAATASWPSCPTPTSVAPPVFSDAVRSRLVARPIMTAAGEMTVAISIGVAFMRPGMELSPDELLAAADEALASARAAGGNRIAFDRMHGLMRIDERQSFEERKLVGQQRGRLEGHNIAVRGLSTPQHVVDNRLHRA